MRTVYVLLFFLAGCRPSNQIGELVGFPSHRPLEGTVWVLEELNDKVINAVEGQRSLFIFYNKDDKTVRGFGGCNSFSGSFTKSGSTVSATVASTRMFCDGKMELENNFMKVLGLSNKYEVDENHLFLKNEGKVVAEFRVEVNTSH